MLSELAFCAVYLSYGAENEPEKFLRIEKLSYICVLDEPLMHIS